MIELESSFRIFNGAEVMVHIKFNQHGVGGFSLTISIIDGS